MPISFNILFSKTAKDISEKLNSSPPIQANEILKLGKYGAITNTYFFPYYFIPSFMGSLVSINCKGEQRPFLYNEKAMYFKVAHPPFDPVNFGAVCFPCVSAIDWIESYNNGVIAGIANKFFDDNLKASAAQWIILHNVVVFLWMPQSNKDIDIVGTQYMQNALLKFTEISQDGKLNKLYNDLIKQFPEYGKLVKVEEPEPDKSGNGSFSSYSSSSMLPLFAGAVLLYLILKKR